MEQLNQDINLLINNKVNYSIWNKIYNKFIEISQCGGLTFIEIKECINVLLKSTVICETKPEEKILELQKTKLELLKKLNPAKDNSQVDSIRKIKEYKSCLAMSVSYDIKNTRNIR